MRLLPVLLVASLVGCASYGFNYLDPYQPRCAGRFRQAPPEVSEERSFKVASFNIAFGRNPEQAVKTLRKAELDQADVLLLQEMDLPGTISVARSLGYDYVYYPSALHPKSRRQFGLAILSPWPIRADRKILLPKLSSSDDARKIAVVAKVWIRGVPMGVVNVHIDTRLDPVAIGDQLQVVTGCLVGETCLQRGAPMLPGLPFYVMAGDFNTGGSDQIAVAREVLGWVGLKQVPGIGRTHKLLTEEKGRMDHIFASGELGVVGSGVVPGFFGLGSDHRPIWAELRLPASAPAPWQGFDESVDWPAATPETAGVCGQR